MTAADNITSAVRQLVVDTNDYNNRVFLRRAPEKATLPYVTLLPNIGTQPHLLGDAETMAFSRMMQVDLWQKTSEEKTSLVADLRNALDGATIELSTGKAWRLRVESDNDVPEPFGTNVVHHSFTCTLMHTPSAN